MKNQDKNQDKNQEIKLGAISGIDDEILERTSKKRFELWGRIKKKNPARVWIPVVAGAACIALLSGWLLGILPTLGKQIPVYQGMTVSHTPQTVAALPAEPTHDSLLAVSMAKANLSHSRPRALLKEGNNGNHYGQNKETDTDGLETESPSTLSGLEGARELYYAQRNQDIYITIHFSNPDDYEILSFTLNGEKYSSYMFEAGSDMEHLILKKNVGDAEGIVEYTIDAIKYVDGTDIKDVRMDGNRTVKVGVYTEKQPTATVSNLLPDFNAIRFDVAVADEMKLITHSKGKLYAMLYQGETLVGEKEISIEETTSVAFEGLALDTEYRYVIEAEYDNLSGEGKKRYVLLEDTARTPLALRFDAPSTTQTELSFGLIWNEAYTQKELTSLTLYHGETKLRDLSLTDRAATNLLSNNEYRVVATYRNGEEEKTVTHTFKTQAKATPTLTITAPTKTQTEIGFTLNETDTDHVGAITRIELLHGSDTPTVAENLTTRSFTSLLSNNTYTVKVTYVYDLNDGVGNQTITKTLDIKTEAKATPTLTITAPTKTQTEIGFTLNETDTDNVGAITRIELLHGNDTPTVAENLTTRSFTSLLSNNTYTVKVTYVYDLNDGVGNQTVTKTLDIKTEAKATPVFTVANETTTAERVTADLSYTDPDAILSSYKVELYKGSALVSEHAEKKIDFSALDAYTDYTVKITYTYDLNDGVGTQTATKTLEVKTLPFIDVTACTVTNVEAIVSGDIIVMRLDLNNPSGVNVTHVTVSGEKYAVTTGTAAFLLIHIPCDESFPGGEATLTVETLEGTLGGKTYTLTPATEASQTVFINGNLTVLGIEFVNESMESVSWAFPSDTVYLMIRLENPTGYTVDQVTVNGTAYTPTKLSDNEYYCTVPLSSGSGTYTLSALSYRNENLERSLTLTETCTLMRLTSDTVQYVSTPEDLLNMNGHSYYELMGDVDLSGRQWQGSAFNGVLNGKGYAVKNLTYIGSVADGASVGLFSTAQGVIQNLSLENVNLVVQGERELYVGALAGSSSGALVIENCHVSGSISIPVSSGLQPITVVGGLVGRTENYSTATITNSTNSASVSVTGKGNPYVGGLVGHATYGSSVAITNSTNSGAVSVTGKGHAYVGGLVGWAYSGSVITITNSTNSGAVSGNSMVGGLVGDATGGSVTITNSTNSGAVSGEYNIGGLVGYANSSSVTITNSTNSGTVSGTGGEIGGMVGVVQSSSVTITNSTNSGTVTVTVSSTGTISVYVGGLVGYAPSGSVTITNSTNSGTVTVSSTGAISVYVGGLVGDTESGAPPTITNSYTIKAYNSIDVLCTVEQLNTPSFYTDTLGWSEEIWDLTDLDVKNGKYPKLKH